MNLAEKRRQRRRRRRRKKGRQSRTKLVLREKFHRVWKLRRHRLYLFKKQNGICAICGKPMKKSECDLDHKIPLSKGGTDEFNNLQATHMTCNRRKSDDFPEDSRC